MRCSRAQAAGKDRLSPVRLAAITSPSFPFEESTRAGSPAHSASEKSDYDLVKEIGTKGAWEVFLNQYPSGFYADLARQQLRKLEPPPQAQAQRVAGEPEAVATAALTLANLPSPASPPSEEQVAWDKIKDSTTFGRSAISSSGIRRRRSPPPHNAAWRRSNAPLRSVRKKGSPSGRVRSPQWRAKKPKLKALSRRRRLAKGPEPSPRSGAG